MAAVTPLLSKTRIMQGEIYYIMPQGEIADPNVFFGGRPAIIMSNDMINEYKGVVDVIWLTTHPKEQLPTYVEIKETNKKSYAVCDEPTTVSKLRIGKYIGQCSTQELQEIQSALALTFTAEINQLSKKSIESILLKWQENMQKTMTTDEISEYPVEDFETPDEPVVVQTAPQPETQPDVIFPSQDITTNPEYIRLQAERDIYKKLYDELLQKTISQNT